MKKLLMGFLLIIPIMASADRTDAYCKIFNKTGQSLVSEAKCSFSQYQGYIYLTLADKQTIRLTPVGNTAGNFKDQNNQPVYRKKGLGTKGQVFQFEDKLIKVYWDINQFAKARIDLKPIDFQHVALNFKGVKIKLARQEGELFTGVAEGRIAIYHSQTGGLIVLNQADGKLIAASQEHPIPSFENPDTMCDPSREPC